MLNITNKVHFKRGFPWLEKLIQVIHILTDKLEITDKQREKNETTHNPIA